MIDLIQVAHCLHGGLSYHESIATAGADRSENNRNLNQSQFRKEE